ncbi:mitochondrial carrier [Aaosphaeria arxii CBS 175.79]|uniref:Mitochondrial carrier n=1 Tax=Aaosphaeria arxii CBS 175.79 TaxID=1450172 RepID=A0A6A5Y496_9PLEO|nr:mitochondrial carrier [Aaosphaeria arxii CBS 175.79]KAF2019847.1 mitochondrial carrier [Aaosphaeria arxii CBS 175.79]
MTYVYNSQLDAFTLYHIVQEESSPQESGIGPALPALGHAVSGAAGTAISKLITYPLDLVITRLQVQKQFQTEDHKEANYKNFQDAVEKIYDAEGGIKAFYTGVVPETLKSVTDSFLFFLAYTYARQRRLNSQGTRSLSALDEIGVGVVAGAFSKFWTTPLQNIVTRKQTAAMVAARDPSATASPNLSLKDIALQIREEKGLQGFWSGYSASLVLTLNPSITFLLHKVLLRLLVPRDRRQDPGARITFLLAAISKALASTVTYPFSLAKARAQVSSQKPAQPTGPTSETEKPAAALDPLTVKARQRTVFSTILRIAKTEGIWALYQGLGAEVVKGFFSHGITMLMKDRIHAAIINIYYLILKSMKKYPSPEELAKQASTQAQDAYEQGKEQAGEAYSRSVEAAGSAATKAQDVLASAATQTKDALDKTAKSVAEESSKVIKTSKA